MPIEDYPRPPVRRLRVYAFDPQASTKIDTAGINVATIALAWEADQEDDLRPGPVNDYLEVIDIDPMSGQFYDPVDLNHAHLLAQDGLAPSEGDPRFHQQMVFAVAMKTIRAFERALGRRIFWAPRKKDDNSYERVQRLRVYPHALREPNAYYSKQKTALLFGYFRSMARDAGASWVFTALSHDVVVHETTHAILDGLHRRYAEPTSVDSLAFHEAFADIVALLSHFTLSEAVHAEIGANGGHLDQRTLMTGLARQFGRATGRGGALREAIDDKIDGKIGGEPDPNQLDSLTEPHARGAVLVAAVFEAFLTIYQRRSQDLTRLAGVEPGSGRALHPDLVARLAREATKSAEHVLRMCLRALDYMPPVDVRFGEFLRGIVTADTDLVPLDRYGYRIAMIEAFRRRGIVPEGCLSLAPDSLLWEGDASNPPLTIKDLPALDLERAEKREDAARIADENRELVHRWLMKSGDAATGKRANDADWQRACGVIFRAGLDKGPDGKPLPDPYTVTDWPAQDNAEGKLRRLPSVEVHSVRTTLRTGPDGQEVRQLVIEVAQRRRGFFDVKEQDREDGEQQASPASPDFTFRGGATLIFDMFTGKLRYAIRKRINDERRLQMQRDFLVDRSGGTLAMIYSDDDAMGEPFAMIHRGEY